MKKYVLLFCFVSVLVLSCSNPTTENPGNTENSSVVEVTDPISSLVKWTADKTYYVNNTIYVELGGTLSIEAGTVVKFNAEGKLLVESGGVIVATGTAAKPIYFTSYRDSSVGEAITDAAGVTAAAGNWQGVFISEGSTSNSFTHCIFTYGGINRSAVLKIYGVTTVDSCTFHDNLGGHPYATNAYDYATLDAFEAPAGTVIRNNLFYRNLWPLAISQTLSLDASNTFSYDEDGDTTTPAVTNTQQGIYIFHGNIDGTVSWAETEVPLCFFGNLLRVTGTGSLTIASGAVVKNMSSEFQVEYNGVLNRTGVIFTSFRDDSCIGDTNADGTVTSPAKGDWTGIEYLTEDSYYAKDAKNIRYADEPTD